MLRSIFKWQNQDSTLDLNTRISSISSKGILSGGLISTVSGQLKIQIQPLTCMSNDGMLVIDESPSSAGLLSVPLGQTSAVALQAKYNIGSDPTLSYIVQEITAFNNRIDRNDFVLLAQVTPSGVVEIASTDISYINRESVDRLVRSPFRGKVASYANTGSLPVPPASGVTFAMVVPALPLLPTLYEWLGTGLGWQAEDPTKLKLGDFFLVIEGTGALPSLFSWDGLEWLNITDALAVTADLAQHRANLFPNEKHMTDDQADAALGSVGPVSLINRYVSELDTRLPTQGENNALVGSDGAPSATNTYLTQEYFIAQPSIISFGSSPGSSAEISAGNGPIFVGTGAVGSANNFFSFLDISAERGYINSQGYAPNIVGVYKDVLLTSLLNPLADADAYGFYAGALYLAADAALNTGMRVVYGKKTTAKNLDKGICLLPSPSSEYVSSKAVESIQNIKGRPYSILLPNREQNKTLRQGLDGIVGYLGSALQTNLVASKEDFDRLSNDTRIRPEAIGNYTRSSNIVTVYSPAHGLVGGISIAVISSTGTPAIAAGDKTISVVDGDIFTFIDAGADSLGIVSYTYSLFLYNIGIDPVYRFPNNVFTSFSYDATNGRITYGAAVDLTQCAPGNLFQDSGGNTFLVTSVTPGGINPYLNIVSIETGYIPPDSAVDTATPVKLQDGSVIVNNNQRNCLLSEFKLNYGSDVVPVSYIYPLPSEFEYQTGQLSYCVKREDGSVDPRVVLYGGWENFTGGDIKKSYVRNTGAYAKIVVTGFFTDVILWMRRTDNTPDFLVQLNEESPYLVSSKQSSAPGLDSHRKYNKLYVLGVPIGTSLLNEPNTCTIYVNAPADPVEIYAIEMCRSSVDAYSARTNSLLESGRAFDLTKIVISDAVDSSLAVNESYSTVPVRGHRKIVSVTDYSPAASVNTFSLADIDSSLTGTVNSLTQLTNVTGPGVSAFRLYDLILVTDGPFTGDTYYETGTAVASNTITLTGPLDSAVGAGWVVEGSGVPLNTTVTLNNNPSATIQVSTPVTLTSTPLRFYQKGNAQVVQINGVTPAGINVYTWDITPSLDPSVFSLTSSVSVTHVCSTESTVPNVGEEEEIARFNLISDFATGFPGDFELGDSSNRFVVGSDGTTVIAGENLSVVSSGLTGQTKAVNITTTGTLRIAALCTRLDIIVANSSSANPVSISVDGSDVIYFNFSDASSYRRTLFFNARYQTHEITISDPSGVLCISDIILFGPAKPDLTDFPVEIGDMRGLAKYVHSSSYKVIGSQSRYPLGAVFLEATTYCTYQDNAILPLSDWTVADGYSGGYLKNPYGPYIYTATQDAYAEFYFLGDTFEVQFITGPDHGNFKIYIDGIAMDSGPYFYPIGDYATGEVIGYSPTYSRKNIGAVILYPSNEEEWSVHHVKIVATATKNIVSTDYRVALVGVWLASAQGAYYCTNQNKGLFSSAKDSRKFLAVPPQQVTSDISQPLVADSRAASVACSSGSTSKSVSYTNPLPDENYVLMLNFTNTVDTYPLLQPVFVTSKTATGFTATWNAPLDSNSYKLNYFVAPFK